jgi:(2Fe-2S) ferredoxin
MGERGEGDPPLYYETHVFICTNRRPDGHKRGSCAARGSEPLRDYMKARAKELDMEGVRINSAGCLDRCELGPCAVLYPEGIWYRVDSREAADQVLEQHLRKNGRVTALQLPPETAKN